MLRVYDFIFYVIYKAFLKLSEKDFPEGKAAALLSLWSFFYLLLAATKVNSVLPGFKMQKIHVPFVIVFLFGFNYFYFISSKRYSTIFQKLDDEFEFKRGIRILVLLSYLIFPILMFAYVLS